MKPAKLILHKSTVRQLGSESLKTFKGGGLTLPGCVNLIPAPKPPKWKHTDHCTKNTTPTQEGLLCLGSTLGCHTSGPGCVNTWDMDCKHD